MTESQIVGLEVEVVERRDTLGAWAVETINHAGDGEIYMAVFSGPLARERATEYASMKYGVKQEKGPEL